MLSTIDVELKLVIAGNHDLSLDYTHNQKRGFNQYHIDDDEDEDDDESDDDDDSEKALELMKGPLAREVCSRDMHSNYCRTICSKLIVVASGWCDIFG